MAKILTITKNDTPESIKKKMEEWNKISFTQKGFPAHKFTGKIKSFGDHVEYQRRIRDEWE